MKFIPFFFRKEPVFLHKDCKNFNVETRKCERRNVIVQKNEFACKHINTLDTIDEYAKFNCRHNGCSMEHPIELPTVEFDTPKARIEVGFFKCPDCGEITAVFQTDSQNVIAVMSDEDYCNDSNWLTAKISTAV